MMKSLKSLANIATESAQEGSAKTSIKASKEEEQELALAVEIERVYGMSLSWTFLNKD